MNVTVNANKLNALHERVTSRPRTKKRTRNNNASNAVLVFIQPKNWHSAGNFKMRRKMTRENFNKFKNALTKLNANEARMLLRNMGYINLMTKLTKMRI